MDTLIISTCLTKAVAGYSKLLVGYSGGVDSSVLLHALVQLRAHSRPDLMIRAIHIHHGLSPHADEWAAHCQQQCQLWRVPFMMHQVELTARGNIEAQARDARYQAIKATLQADEVLCTAQHLDDQSETFLLALKRGSGPAGLAAMAKCTPFAHSQLLRPLLSISRTQIEAYAVNAQLQWVEDESNLDVHYDRNFLRLQILPRLNQRWPHFNQMVQRSSELCGEQQQLLEMLLSDELTHLINPQGGMTIAPLSLFPAIKRNALLRLWFKQQQLLMPSRTQLELIWQTVALAQTDAAPCFKLGPKQLRRYRGALYVLPLTADLQSFCRTWSFSPLHLPDNIGYLTAEFNGEQANCRLPALDEQVSVRFTAQGHQSIVGRSGSRAIKKLWQELAIPPWQRHRIPLIFYNEQLICAVGVFVTEAGQGDAIAFKLDSCANS